MKRQSLIGQLVSASRGVWRYSETYRIVKKLAKLEGRSGWFTCNNCKEAVEVIKVDHVKPIGKQPTKLEDFGVWLPKLFCSITNLQSLCNTCHKEKTKEENKLRRLR